MCIRDSYVEYLHIKDALAGGQVVPAGKGDGHVPEILRRYRAQGGRVLTVEPDVYKRQVHK